MMGPWTLMRHLSDGGSGPRNCESCKRHHTKRGSCEKRHFRPEGIPESAGDDTCNQHGDMATPLARLKTPKAVPRKSSGAVSATKVDAMGDAARISRSADY